LDLAGTDLVRLSACETGLGEISNGEGVLGLRRAFQQAGARTIVMSLWRVPDKETSEIMGEFYQLWPQTHSKQEALRQAQLKVMRGLRQATGSASPYYWGAFIVVGEP
jgi:CHAT domain-containing protein